MDSKVALVAATVIVGSLSAGAQEAARPADLATVTLKVAGMKCSLCSATVARTAKRIGGVHEATADQPKGTASVSYDPARITPEEIAKQLTKKSGFRSEVARPPAK